MDESNVYYGARQGETRESRLKRIYGNCRQLMMC